MRKIVEVHFRGDPSHEHLATLRWIDTSESRTGQDTAGESTRMELVDFLRRRRHEVVVQVDGHTESVGVRNGMPPYLQSHERGHWTDELLAVPRY